MQRIMPCLWFDGRAEEAMEFYTSVFKGSKAGKITHYGEAGPGKPGSVMTVAFEIEGMEFMGINGGPQFQFSEAVSFMISCKDQEEVDYYWDRLTADGGKEGQCGWLSDRFGLAWQVVPEGMDEVFSDPDPAKAERSMAAMMKMKKLDIAELRAAAEGVPAG